MIIFNCTYWFDGLQQLNTVLLNAAVSISKLHKRLTGCSLRLPNPNDRENIPKRWNGTLSNPKHMLDTRSDKWKDLPRSENFVVSFQTLISVTDLCESEKAQKMLWAASLCAPSALQKNRGQLVSLHDTHFNSVRLNITWFVCFLLVKCCHPIALHLCRALLFSPAPLVFWPVRLKSYKSSYEKSFISICINELTCSWWSW